MNKSGIRLAFVIPSMGDGGSNRFMMKVATGMAERGFAVDLIAIDPRGQYAQEKLVGVRRIDLGVIPVKGVTVLKAIWSLRNYIRRENPHTLMAATTAVNVLVVIANMLARNAARVVVSERNAIQSSAVDASRSSRFYRRLIPTLYSRAAQIVAVSKGVGQELINDYGILPNLVNVIYNPVISPMLMERTEEPVDDIWLERSDVPVIVAVGRLHPQKDFATLINGFALLRRRLDARLIILGEGRCREELHALVCSLGLQDSVRMPGFVPNPYAYMARAQLFVMTSIYEGICNVVIEALGCGCAVVATDCPGGGPREILEDGKWGTLVPVGDSHELAAAMQSSLSKPHNPETYRERAAFFSVDKGLDNYERLFTELV